MADVERESDDYGARLSGIYAEQVSGLRQQLAAVDRNVLRYIAEGRDRGEQIAAIATQLGACATELGQLRQLTRVQRWIVVALALLALGVGALLVKVF